MPWTEAEKSAHRRARLRQQRALRKPSPNELGWSNGWELSETSPLSFDNVIERVGEQQVSCFVVGKGRGEFEVGRKGADLTVWTAATATSAVPSGFAVEATDPKGSLVGEASSRYRKRCPNSKGLVLESVPGQVSP